MLPLAPALPGESDADAAALLMTPPFLPRPGDVADWIDRGGAFRSDGVTTLSSGREDADCISPRAVGRKGIAEDDAEEDADEDAEADDDAESGRRRALRPGEGEGCG